MLAVGIVQDTFTGEARQGEGGKEVMTGGYFSKNKIGGGGGLTPLARIDSHALSKGML